MPAPVPPDPKVAPQQARTFHAPEYCPPSVSATAVPARKSPLPNRPTGQWRAALARHGGSGGHAARAAIDPNASRNRAKQQAGRGKKRIEISTIHSRIGF